MQRPVKLLLAIDKMTGGSLRIAEAYQCTPNINSCEFTN